MLLAGVYSAPDENEYQCDPFEPMATDSYVLSQLRDDFHIAGEEYQKRSHRGRKIAGD